jgi:hypothetical protein
MDEPDRPSPEELEALQEQLATFSVDQFVVSAASTIASIAYAKLERGQLGEAKKGIDALAALMPHVDEAVRAELQLALTGLQVAFAEAAS